VKISTTSSKNIGWDSYFIRNDFVIGQPLMQTPKVWDLIKNKSKISQPILISNEIEFTKKKDNIKLSNGSLKIQNTPNAGGTSVSSEVMSFELLSSLFNAQLLFTEMDLEYSVGSKITDFSVKIQNETVGVSVTRAMKFRGNFNNDDAQKLLEKKLNGVIQSTNGVSSNQKWKRQILHVWVEYDYIKDILVDIYNSKISNELKSNTIVVVFDFNSLLIFEL